MTWIFKLSNLLVLPFRGLMILLPRWRWTERIMRSTLVSVAPALFYVALVLPRLGTILPAVARPTLEGVAALLGSPEGATIAWVLFPRLRPLYRTLDLYGQPGAAAQRAAECANPVFAP